MKNKSWIIIVVAVIIVLFIPIISDSIKKQNIELLTSKEVKEKINSGESFILYVGDIDKSVKKDLNKLKDITKEEYSIDYSIYNVKSSYSDKKIIIYIEGELQKEYKKYNKKTLEKDINVYYIGRINDDNRTYKVAENYNEYRNLVKSEEVIMAVFGRDNCFYCNKFKPVYNAVAEKYNIDIYFFDSLSYNSSDYTKIINMDLTIPAKCSSDGKDFKLSDGFGTPLTIYTKNNEVVDCISGYVNRSSLVEKLKTNNMISE